MILVEKKGDLFSCPPTDSLAHCISEDCRMGKGIAIKFKENFGGVDELKKQVADGAKTGHVAILEKEDRFVYYLITKKRAFDKPTYQTLRPSLEAMRQHALDNNVRRISMPRIGCGLDGLAWGFVKGMLESVFENTNIDITVYSL